MAPIWSILNSFWSRDKSQDLLTWILGKFTAIPPLHFISLDLYSPFSQLKAYQNSIEAVPSHLPERKQYWRGRITQTITNSKGQDHWMLLNSPVFPSSIASPATSPAVFFPSKAYVHVQHILFIYVHADSWKKSLTTDLWAMVYKLCWLFSIILYFSVCLPILFFVMLLTNAPRMKIGFLSM